MPSTSAPFGMRPAYHPSGLDRAFALAGGIASAYSSAILKGAPVKMATTGVIQAAAAGDAFLGAFAGVEYTDTNGRRVVSNQWIANTAYQTGSCVAYFYQDPRIVYEIQCDGSLAQTSIGDEADLSNVTAGSTVTGLSQCTLSSTLKAAGNNGQMRIIGLAGGADNAWGDTYVVVQAVITKSQYEAVSNAI